MRGRLPDVAEEGDVKVPIEGEDMIDEEAAQATEAEGAQEPVEPEAVEQDDEELERARVEAAIRAGEEAAERDMAADAARAREERDDLQKRLGDAEEQVEAPRRRPPTPRSAWSASRPTGTTTAAAPPPRAWPRRGARPRISSATCSRSSTTWSAPSSTPARPRATPR